MITENRTNAVFLTLAEYGSNDGLTFMIEESPILAWDYEVGSDSVTIVKPLLTEDACILDDYVCYVNFDTNWSGSLYQTKFYRRLVTLLSNGGTVFDIRSSNILNKLYQLEAMGGESKLFDVRNEWIINARLLLSVNEI